MKTSKGIKSKEIDRGNNLVFFLTPAEVLDSISLENLSIWRVLYRVFLIITHIAK